MKRFHPRIALIVSLLLVAPAALACGEGSFNMGQGLRYQTYLAPRPASVLIYTDSKTSQRRPELYRGLQKAGHKLTVVSDPAALSAAMRERRYDVAIAALGQVAALDTQAQQTSAPPKLLPVVRRDERDAPQLRDRFKLYLLDSASLGQYLKVINQLLPAGTR